MGQVSTKFGLGFGKTWVRYGRNFGHVETKFGSDINSLPISFEKRFRIRPAGFVSKNLIGDWMTPLNQGSTDYGGYPIIKQKFSEGDLSRG